MKTTAQGDTAFHSQNSLPIANCVFARPRGKACAPWLRVIALALVCLFHSPALQSAPIISPIPHLVTLEDVPLLNVPFTIEDPETAPDDLVVSATFFLQQRSASISVSGSGTQRLLSLFPPQDAFGSGNGSVTVRNGRGLTSSRQFLVTVLPVNDPPRLSQIPSQAALRGQGTLSIPFPIADAEAEPITFQAWSSRKNVVPDSALQVFPGNSPTNRTLRVTLASSSPAGSTAITVTANDSHDRSEIRFILDVLEPEFTRLAPVNAFNSTFRPVPGDFNGDGRMDLLVSPTEIFGNAGGTNFTLMTKLTAPVSALEVQPGDFDGDGDLDLLFGTDAPVVFRYDGASPPGFVSVPMPTTSRFGIGAMWADLDQDGDLDIVPGRWGASWLRNDGARGFAVAPLGVTQQLSGRILNTRDVTGDGIADILAVHSNSGEASPLRLWAGKGNGQFQDLGLSFPTGIPESTLRSGGWVDVDGDGTPELWLMQAPFTPSVSNSMVVLRQTASRFIEHFRHTWRPIGATPFTTNVVWADFDHDGHMDFAGPIDVPSATGFATTNVTVIFHNDGHGHFRHTGLAATVEFGQPSGTIGDFDEDGATDMVYRQGRSLVVLRNHSPVVNSLPEPPRGLLAIDTVDSVFLFWNESEDANQSSALTYNVRVGTRPGANDVVASMSTTNGLRLVPQPGNAGFNTRMRLVLPPTLDTEFLYWSVQAVDASFQGGPFAQEQVLPVFLPGNQPPLITGIGDVTVAEDTPITITFHVRDDRTPPQNLLVDATSSNPDLIPQSKLQLSGFVPDPDGLRITLNLTPLLNEAGQSEITITATDRAGLASTRKFVVTVTPQNDPPELTVPAKHYALAGQTSPPLTLTPTDPESAAADLILSARSLTPALVPDDRIALTRSSGVWTLTATPASAQPGEAMIELKVQDPQGGETQTNVALVFQEVLASPLVSQGLGFLPEALGWADFDGDRKMDLLVARNSEFTIHTVQTGSLPIANSTPMTGFGDFADVDLDGDVDILGFNQVAPLLVRQAIILRNSGAFRFELAQEAAFQPGLARFSDFDLDGRPDVLIVPKATNVLMYRNGIGGFEPACSFPLKSTVPPEIAVVQFTAHDLNQDGRDELVLVIDPQAPRQVVFQWTGDGYTAISKIWAPRLIHAVADLDQDQRPDLVTHNHRGLRAFWRNTEALEFTQTTGIILGTGTSAAVVDFDGDGAVDVLDHNGSTNRLYLWKGEFKFAPIDLSFANAELPVAAPADFNHDGRLELATGLLPKSTAGISEPAQLRIYQFDTRTPNVRPGTPENLRTEVFNATAVTLIWDEANDANQGGGLTYNVRVGTAPGSSDVISALALADGTRLVPRIGNAGWQRQKTVTGLTPGRTYYWSVQAIDNTFAGGTFAAEQAFRIGELRLTIKLSTTDAIEIEAPGVTASGWTIEVSEDLQTWREYSLEDAQVTTNNSLRINLEPVNRQQFFRIRQH
ncbi:MAG: FG-GAP-like repeat-containing protein [Verrucomicrobiota bacterium]